MAIYNGDKQNHGIAANGPIDGAPNVNATDSGDVRFSGGMVWAWADIKPKVLQGTEGNDYLQGNDGEQNTLSGLGGDDTLVGGNLNDTLIGGTGNDRLMGNGGNDTYLFAKGDGVDVIDNYDADSGVDIVKFTDMAATDITRITRYGDNLMVYGRDCRVYVSQYFSGTAYRIDQFQFSDGVVWTFDDIVPMLLLGTGYSDNLYGYADMPNQLSGKNGNDKLYGGNVADILDGGADKDTLFGYAGDDLLIGGAGNDKLYGGDGNDTLKGGLGNDIIEDSGGSDTYLFSKGDGVDSLANHGNGSFTDSGRFTDVASTEVSVTFWGKGVLQIDYGVGDRLTVQGYFFPGSDLRIDKFRFSDGVVWNTADILLRVLHPTEGNDHLNGLDDAKNSLSGLGGNDKLYGRNLADTLDGGAGSDKLYGQGGNDVLLGGDGRDYLDGGIGNDTLNGGKSADKLYGGSGSDTYLFAAGDGSDWLVDADGIGDRITFTDVTSAQTKISRAGNDLLLDYGKQGLLTVAFYFLSPHGSIEQFQWSDGVVWKWGDIAQKVLQGTEGDDSLQGYDDKHAHLFGLGGNDAIYGANLADTLDGGAGNDKLYAKGGSDVLLGGDGDDTLDGGLGGDVLNGGKGNDSLYGGSDSDTYLFAAGDGLDSLYDTGGIADRITFTDVTSAQVKVSRAASGDLLLAYGTQSLLTVTSYFLTANGSVEQFRLSDGVVWKWGDIAQKVLQGTEDNDYLQGYYGKHAHLLGLGGNDVIYGANLADTLDGGAGNDTFHAQDGNDVLLGGEGDDMLDGGSGDDVLSGGKGHDSLYGGNGSDTYLFTAGDGLDSVYEFDGIADKVKFTGAAVTDAVLSRDAHSSLWFNFGNGDRIVIAGYFIADMFHIEQFKFTGTVVGEVFIGKLPGEALVGNADNNILVASAGSESLAGGAGDDWYRLNDSGDTVTEAADAGHDTVISSVSYTLAANVENLVLKGTAQAGSGNPLDNRVDGNAADNTLNGGSGNDVLSGKQGNDLLSGGEGADVLSGGLGQDIFFLAETVAATDTVKIAATDSLATGLDTVTRFGLGDGISTAGADRLDLGTVNIAADVAAADGVNVGSLKSHSISNGLVSFGNTDSYTGAVSLASVGTALDYLQANLTGGITVAFTALGSTYLFQDGSVIDTVVQLLGVEAANLNTTGLVAGGVWLV